MDSKSKMDPGWNDPPMLNYTAANPPPKSRITNKRIAFPLNSANTSNSSTTPSMVPNPNLPPTAPPPPTQLPESTSESLSRLLNSDEAKQNFNKVWDSELPDEFKKYINLLISCVTSNDKKSAELHKQTLLSKYQTLCDGWIDNLNFDVQ